VTEHIQLLAEAGLLEVTIAPSGMGSKRISIAFVRRQTWEGHQFLQAARNEEVWQRTKRFVRDKGGAITLEMLKVLLLKTAAQHFGLSP
jgi:hypothetical protein